MTLIYKIYDNTTTKSYVGSTNQKLHRRMVTHNKKDNNCSSKQIILNNNYSVSILEECTEENRNIREQYWIDNTPNIVNIKRACPDLGYKKKYCLQNKDHKKKYDQNRREWIKSWGMKLDRYSDNNMLRINPSVFY